MWFEPKEAWQSDRVLSGGNTSRNDSPTIMQMLLPNSKLAKTDA